MLGLIVLCLCTSGLAAPSGYNYNQGGPSDVQQPIHAGLMGSLGVAASTSGGSFFPNGHAVQHTSFGGHQLQQHQQQAIISKRFFIHSAPEDVEEDYKEQHITVGVPRKNYNIVFIKSPVKSHKKTAIKISPALNEEKTVIYVLSKKTDAADIQAEVVEHATTTAKPEVYFIKYKTSEEATHAQEQIQAQYDALGGSSQITDEGVASVTSVVGSLGGGHNRGAGNDVAGGYTSSAAGFGNRKAVSNSFGSIQTDAVSVAGNNNNNHNNNSYLPPSFY